MAAPSRPDFLADLVDKGIDQQVTQGIVSFDRPPFISIEKNRFSLVDAQGQKETLREFELTLVVVGGNLHLSKLYYGRPYDPAADDHEPPKCFSDNGTAPSQNAMEPQNATCQGCPRNVWGSDTSNLSGKAIKACSDRKKLAVLYNGELFQMVIPPASLKNWQKYAESVAKHPQASINTVTTEITFDAKVQGVLNFRATGWIDQKTADEVRKIKSKGSQALDYYTGNDDKPRTATIEGPKPAQLDKVEEKPAPKVHTMEPAPPKRVKKEPTESKGEFLNASREAEKPKKNGGTPAFGMVDTPVVQDADIESAIGSAMGFLQE